MITEENNEQLEDEVRGILEEAGWTDRAEPDLGRMEVIAYRACLEGTHRGATPSTCCDLSRNDKSQSGSRQTCSVCGSSILSSARVEDDKLDEDPCAGSTRA